MSLNISFSHIYFHVITYYFCSKCNLIYSSFELLTYFTFCSKCGDIIMFKSTRLSDEELNIFKSFFTEEVALTYITSFNYVTTKHDEDKYDAKYGTKNFTLCNLSSLTSYNLLQMNRFISKDN